MLFLEGPPPLPFQPVADAHDPPGPLVVKSVPPTEITYGSSAGQTESPGVLEPSSPLATNRLCPWAANSLKIGSRLLSLSVHPQEQLSCLDVLSDAIRPKIETSLLPT